MRLLTLLILGACTAEPELPPIATAAQAPVQEMTFEERFMAGDPAEVALELSDADAESLRLEPREYVPAELTIDGMVHEVRIRLKGNGSFQPFDSKPSLRVKFNKPFAGLKILILNNTTSDPSFASERLAARAYAIAGVPAARAGHAWLVVNGENRGLYTALEDVDARMLARWFDDPEGSLYEMSDGDFSTELLGGIEHEDGPDATEDLLAIVEALDLGDAIGFDQATQFVDRTSFLRYTAVTAVVAQTDAYPYSRPGDDAYLYRDPDQGRFHFLPHGLDEAFRPRDRTLSYLNGRLARRCLANVGCRTELAEHIDQVFEELAVGWPAEVDDLLSRLVSWDADSRQDWVVLGSFEERTRVYQDWLPTRRMQLESELQEL